MHVFFVAVLRREEESEPEMNLIFTAEPVEGESTVETAEHARAYALHAVPQALAEYPEGRRYFPPAFCVACKTNVWAPSSLPMRELLRPPHVSITHLYPRMIGHAALYHCGKPECADETFAYANSILSAKRLKTLTEAPDGRADVMAALAPRTPTVTEEDDEPSAPMEPSPPTPSTPATPMEASPPTPSTPAAPMEASPPTPSTPATPMEPSPSDSAIVS